ncbi:Homeobox-leucine zipper protein PROTODERMAL FACTOR 2 [Cucurbita argyrosperma subsp. argyrosperma]|uniref:Homeobox-leucine zipper protein PROTODERMAL FACTOR 2-like n=1 Tax=Cucurbita moschata TaxID=3662 RepID=A0A6J1EER9_CUCMO|nr:homeobox-leucine zipper protein PROTODERMAL FACTOR 2-like [Cucurbita moschata]KAG7026621.1 Homeobox-leucine zipper protein PROTODERMAL FACTOR 2 [Cucurbita argyrosperma subsp. argyrosperma]
MFDPDMFDTHHHMLDMTFNTSENELENVRDDDFEAKSGAEMLEEACGSDQQRSKKKRYNRHTQHQIQEMEAFFKECPHPDDKQRMELSRELGLEPLQVKFWFQNKRTQMKAQHERHENAMLKADNEKLRAENIRYREAFAHSTCPNCGSSTALGEMSFEDQHLRIENSRLRDEIDRMNGYAPKCGKPLPSSYYHLPSNAPTRSLDLGITNFGQQSCFVGEMYGTADFLRSISRPSEADKPVIVELAVSAMDELTRMAQAGEPLWVPGDTKSSEVVLNESEYLTSFRGGIGPKSLGLRTEASRVSAIVFMNHVKLVDIFMDATQWSTVFCGIVSRASTVEVLSAGLPGNCNGALHVMSAEFQVPSPLVPTRENYFVRYCKQHSDGTWAVADVSLDTLTPSPIPKGRRRPSGCLIQELPNGYSKITWVEHVEVDETGVPSMYRPLVNSGLAFGAKRWVATLDRQCERLATSMATTIATGELRVMSSIEGRKSMLKLAERMVTSFCAGVGASSIHAWTALPAAGSDDVRVVTRKSTDEPGRPPGVVLSAATSFWIPVSPKVVFDFLRKEKSRSEWDILSNRGLVQEMANIANGRHSGNCVSLLRVNSANSSQSNMLILQESCTDSTGSYVVYAPVDTVAMNVVLSGCDPDYVALLPSGFAILPDGPAGSNGGGILEVGSGGSLITVAFQILVDSVPTARLSIGSVATVNSLIKCTVERIRAAVMRETHD